MLKHEKCFMNPLGISLPNHYTVFNILFVQKPAGCATKQEGRTAYIKLSELLVMKEEMFFFPLYNLFTIKKQTFQLHSCLLRQCL